MIKTQQDKLYIFLSCYMSIDDKEAAGQTVRLYMCEFVRKDTMLSVLFTEIWPFFVKKALGNDTVNPLYFYLPTYHWFHTHICCHVHYRVV